MYACDVYVRICLRLNTQPDVYCIFVSRWSTRRCITRNKKKRFNKCVFNYETLRTLIFIIKYVFNYETFALQLFLTFELRYDLRDDII